MKNKIGDNIIGDNIKRIKVMRKLTNQELADQSGVPLNTLAKIICGVTTNPTVKNLQAIAEALECPIWELFEDNQGAGSHLSTTETELLTSYRSLSPQARDFVQAMIASAQTYEASLLREADEAYTYELPLYLLPTSAGPGQFLDSDDYEMHSFPAEAVPSGVHFAVRVSGNSMEPAYRDGDIAFVQQTRELEPGEVGIFLLNGEGFIKELGTRNGSSVCLHSFNPAYKDIPIRVDDDLRLVGRVKGKA
jgi:repressor LexA